MAFVNVFFSIEGGGKEGYRGCFWVVFGGIIVVFIVKVKVLGCLCLVMGSF